MRIADGSSLANHRAPRLNTGMKCLPPSLLALFLLSSPLLAQDTPDLNPIFNGQDLAGWVAPENNQWFAVKDGILEVRSGPDQKGATLWTDKDYTDFLLEFEFRFGEGVVDSGIFMRKAHDQIQIGISGSKKRDMTASPYIPKKGYPVEAEGVAELLKATDWNTMRVQAVGPTYTVWLNGKQVMTYTSETAIETGPIGIQLHAKRDMAIDYRNLRAAEL